MKNKKKIKTREKKNALNTSENIINRIKWDPNFDELELIIGYVDRFDGMQEIDIEGFDAGDIPYHRIYYLKYKGKVIWDRKAKIDLLTGSDISKLIKDLEEVQEVETTDEKIEKSDEEKEEGKDEGKEKTKEDVKEDDKEEQVEQIEEPIIEENKKIIFSQKNRRIYQQYTPEDYLEAWMLENNVREIALSHPTHISQRGGYYHIPSDLHNEFIRHWLLSIASEQTFYMEEVRTEIFRLYVDIDIKLTVEKPYNIVEKGWIPIIIQHAISFFGKCIPCIILSECHGKWKDSEHVDATFKSGYSIKFPAIYVDQYKYKHYIQSLSKCMKEKIGSYENMPKNFTFDHVIDEKICEHDRGRMFGSTKYRRGKDLRRIYSFVGWFGPDGTMDINLTNLLKENMFYTLQLTEIRFDKTLNKPLKQRPIIKDKNCIPAIVSIFGEGNYAANIILEKPEFLEEEFWFPDISKFEVKK